MMQYCRYCAYMCCGDANYCSEKKRTFSDYYIKRVNNCRSFIFNEIDALFENKAGYKPRPKKAKNDNQLKLEEQML